MASKADRLLTKSFFHESDEEEDRGDDCGISLEKLNIGLRKKLLVLDLNGLLVRRIFLGNTASIPKSRSPDGIFGSQLVFKRPFCEEFLKFCFERFEVGLWSSAKERNVEGVMNFVMGTLKCRLLFIWDQEECTNSGFVTLEKKDKPIFLKELKKLWNNKKFSLPWPKGRYTSSNTLLIDDTPYKSLLNPPNSAIFPHPYEVEDINDTTLGPMGELRLYLEGVAVVDDVPSYVKENPFGQPGITSKHPSWKYYSKIIQSLTNGSSTEEKVQRKKT